MDYALESEAAMDIKKIDSREFRNALGQFPTGVTIVTTLDSEQKKVGITASSFNTVSLEPPLVLWSIGKDAVSYDAFSSAQYFAVHVLTVDQQSLSDLFAQKGADKFDGTDCRSGLNGIPILPLFAACFQCEIEHRYPGGDHTILVGRVLDFESRDSEPLLFHRGRYKEITGPAANG